MHQMVNKEGDIANATKMGVALVVVVMVVAERISITAVNMVTWWMLDAMRRQRRRRWYK